jgi:PPOX class probable F420-dependent enzyme
LAVLATNYADGTTLLSPVWHEWRDGGFTIVIFDNDAKARHIKRDPRVSVVVADDRVPYAGVEVRARAEIVQMERSLYPPLAKRIAVLNPDGRGGRLDLIRALTAVRTTRQDPVPAHERRGAVAINRVPTRLGLHGQAACRNGLRPTRGGTAGHPRSSRRGGMAEWPPRRRPAGRDRTFERGMVVWADAWQGSCTRLLRSGAVCRWA